MFLKISGGRNYPFSPLGAGLVNAEPTLQFM